MIIDCVSDLHGFFPDFEGGDFLIFAGDYTKTHSGEEFIDFMAYADEVSTKYKHVLYIAGNHDTLFERSILNNVNNNVHYLNDSGITLEGIKFWGTPWSLKFKGMNPRAAAFTGSETLLESKFNAIPSDTDILISHCPPYGILDKNSHGDPCGSKSLSKAIQKSDIKLHIFGHIHEAYGICINHERTYINASHVNQFYKPVNKPIRHIFNSKDLVDYSQGEEGIPLGE